MTKFRLLLYMDQHSTHWGRDKMDAIFQTTFSKAFSWMKMYEFQLRFHWSLFLRVQLTTSRIGSGNGLVTVRRQAIIWIDDGLFHWCIYVSLGFNELRGVIVSLKHGFWTSAKQPWYRDDNCMNQSHNGPTSVRWSPTPPNIRLNELHKNLHFLQKHDDNYKYQSHNGPTTTDVRQLYDHLMVSNIKLNEM